MNALKKIHSLFIKLSKILSRKGIYPFLEKEFSNIKSGSKVLSIGAGGEINALLNAFAVKNNFNVTSFDISDDKHPDLLGDICIYDFKDEKFDVVVIAEVLEHLHSPHLAIDNIYKILHNGGRLILTVPFIFPIHERPYDYYRYTRYGLEYLLRKFGNVSIKERNSWTEAINVLSVRLVMDKSIMAKIFAPLFIILAFINLPFVILFSKIIKTDFITTGYVVSGAK